MPDDSVSGAGLPKKLDLGPLGLEGGALPLLRRALEGASSAERLAVFGSAPDLALHLGVWARAEGDAFLAARPEQVLAAGVAASGARLVGWLELGDARAARWHGARRAGSNRATATGAVLEVAPEGAGLATRGAIVEAGGPRFHFPLNHKDSLWADEVQSLLAQALAGQWNPATAVPWDLPQQHADELEDALAQVLTYLIENETAALIVPARFAAQVHPHYREVQQLLAITAADEARHIEVFTRRLGLYGRQPGLSTAGGQRSLQTLIEEPDFELASLLLSVLGEGSFVQLLWFLYEHAPDPATRALMKLAAQDEARHVAFAVAHLRRHAGLDGTLSGRFAAAIHRRHAALADTSGLNAEVHDALILLAAGSALRSPPAGGDGDPLASTVAPSTDGGPHPLTSPAALAQGQAAVQALVQHMQRGRRQRLELLGFPGEEADALAALHTRNFM
jgi:hypothetical protein